MGIRDFRDIKYHCQAYQKGQKKKMNMVREVWSSLVVVILSCESCTAYCLFPATNLNAHLSRRYLFDRGTENAIDTRPKILLLYHGADNSLELLGLRYTVRYSQASGLLKLPQAMMISRISGEVVPHVSVFAGIHDGTSCGSPDISIKQVIHEIG
jgi:hypothetical protein